MREARGRLVVLAAVIGGGLGCDVSAVWDWWSDDGYAGPGPWLNGLVARPDDGRIRVLYSAYTESSIDRELRLEDEPHGDWGPGAVASVELRLLDEDGREIERRTSDRLGRGIEVWFEGVANGRAYQVEGRALDADRRYGLARRALVVPGVAPETERVWDDAAGPIAFAPGSRFLLLHARSEAGPDLVRLDLETGERLSLTSFAPADPESRDRHLLEDAAWSPDGRYIAYAYAPADRYWRNHEAELRLVRLDGETLEDRVLTSVAWMAIPFWLPDRAAVEFFVPGDDGGWAWRRVGLVGGPIEDVRIFPGKVWPPQADVSADGRFISYGFAEYGDTVSYSLVVEEVGSSREVARVAVPYPGPQHPALAPDGQRIAVGVEIGGSDDSDGGNCEVWTLDLRTGWWTPLTGFPGQLRCVGISGLDWSDDGQWVAVSTCTCVPMGCDPGVYRIRVPDG